MNKLLSCENITKKILYSLFEIVDQNKFSSLKGKILINAFFEPSTRTSLSFESAMKRMGGEVITYYDSYSSSKKGETFEDTIRTLCAYGDILVLRHPKKEFLANAVKVSSIPIINAGNGDGEHPTQAILDLYTIYNHFNKKEQPFDLQKLRVLFIGDIKHSRTIHSLLTLLHLFPHLTISMLPYYNLEPSVECVRQIKENHSQDAVIVERQNIIWKDYDVVYCTRHQKERSDTETNPLDKKDDFILTNDIANQMHNDAIILHPLPRNDELATDVDSNHRAKYFEQAKHGIKVRQALIKMILQYMSITLFGTCRIKNISNNNNLNELITYTHTTKEVIQLIKFLKGELVIPEPYNKLCFRTAITENKFIDYKDTYNKLLVDSDTFIIEICSTKKHIHNNFYLHHLCVDNRFPQWHLNTPIEILNNFMIEKQTDEEIENDILEIQQMLHPKKIVIVSHYNVKKDGQYLNSRNHLINLLDNICNKYNITFINPTIALSSYSQEQLITSDLGHYTEIGIEQISKYMNNFLDSEFNS